MIVLLDISKIKLVDFSFLIFLDYLFELGLILPHPQLLLNLFQLSPILLELREEPSFVCSIFHIFLWLIEGQKKEELSCSFCWDKALIPICMCRNL